ncbi:hypothetical protein [Murinocardiopsis flavida]|uniref:hypothetical protein n=1 Tax=Murinocardiopsis flavida TaxID=645275 RepID=UPI000D0D5E8D
MTTTIRFRPTAEDRRLINAATRAGERPGDVIRRALRLLEREAWLEQARADSVRLRDEDLSDEPDAW